MDIADAADFLTQHRHAAVAAAREDGPPHVSRVVQVFDGDASRVSITEDRVKTDVLRETGLASLHVRGDDDWHWVTLECDAELSTVAMDPEGPVVDTLLEIYEAVSGSHDDPDEFRQAMVDDRRLVLTLRPTAVYGQL